MGIRVSSEGWTTITGPPGTDGLHVRVHRGDDDRFVIMDVFVHGSEITNDALRAISIPRLEAFLNSRPGLAVVGDDEDLTVSRLRDRARRAQPPTPAKSERAKLSRPDGQDPDTFYQQVAAAYVEFAPLTRAPAKEIANEAEVPVTTAHRWIREARRRGFLPPARQGKAG